MERVGNLGVRGKARFQVKALSATCISGSVGVATAWLVIHLASLKDGRRPALADGLGPPVSRLLLLPLLVLCAGVA